MRQAQSTPLVLCTPEWLYLSMKIGTDTFQNIFSISPGARARHIYIVGQTGTGKSILLENLIRQDILAQEGIALIDPHGDLALSVVGHIPQYRYKDLLYISPADLEFPVSLNPLADIEPDRRPFVSEAIVSAFHTVWPDAWGPRMEYIFINALRVLMDMPSASLLMLPKLLSDGSYRNRAVAFTKDPLVRFFWQREFKTYQDKFANEAVAPIQNKVGRVLGIPAIRNILSQRSNTINFREAMDQGKIVVVNLAKGAIGEGPAHLLGALIVSLIANASLSRSTTPQPDRRAFHLYADEFQNFATESFSLILSEARKYGLTLTLAHQHLGQLPEKVRQSVLGNAGTVVAFRIGGEDTALLSRHIGLPNPTNLQDLPNYHAYVRTLVGAAPGEPRLIKGSPPPRRSNPAKAIAKSLSAHSRPRSQVEEIIERFLAA